MSVPARSSSNLLKLFDNVVKAANALSAEYDRREMRFHVFQLVGTTSAASVMIQVSLDGTNWVELTTLTGVSATYRVTDEVLPFIRCKRVDSTGDLITFLAYSASSDGNFE